MGSFRLNRRAILRGASGIAIALPWLEIMGTDRAHAQSASTATRFVTVFQPGGTVTFDDKAGTQPNDRFWPKGTSTAPVMNEITAPLEAVKDKLLFIQGLRMGPEGTGEAHQEGMVGLLTGSRQKGGAGGYSTYASVDQVISKRFQDAGYKRQSIEMAVRWATGKSHGLISPINSLNFEYDGAHSPMPPKIDPQDIFKMFTSVGPDTSGTRELIIARKKSALDFLDKRYAALARRLGSADRAKLEDHLTKVRQLEQSLEAITDGNAACKAPTQVDTAGYNPRTGLQADDNGNVTDTATDANIPLVGKFMMDMMVMALACDLTRVGTFQWTDSEAKHTFPWLNLKDHHHKYQHDAGFQPNQCAMIGKWYCEQHAYLIAAMAKVDMGEGKTLLDQSVVFFGSELSHPPLHNKNNMPFFLAGNGGGLKTGRHLKFSGRTSNDLLVALLNLFGDTRTSFGEASFNKGTLSGLAG